ncbi:MAG: hypothetical protein BWY82_02505 [Verrucomicrobia bacterium ADurb.Bin474]|nr:MAG: hypothetical protein BWY82_02505 [Verrucomicrobia bacterium ADurb.Bin474]
MTRHVLGISHVYGAPGNPTPVGLRTKDDIPVVLEVDLSNDPKSISILKP